MKIIAIDSSALVASVAIVHDDIVVCEYSVQHKKTHSQTLLPMLDELKRTVELDLGSVDAIAIAAGPGSFTGLRIGSATAKALGFALDIPLVEICTLEGLAHNLCNTDKLVCPLMDARREQVYTAVYTFNPAADEPGFAPPYPAALVEPCVVSLAEMAALVNELGRAVIFTGDGVPVHAEALAALVKVPYSFAPPHMNRQRAAALAALALRYLKEKKTVSAADHAPVYLRVSQAERVKAEKAMAALADKAAAPDAKDSPHIRAMTKADIAIVSEIESRTFSMPWKAEDFLLMVEAPFAHYYVAEMDGVPVGAVGMRNVAGDGQITNILVDEPHRRRGIARKMMAHMMVDMAGQTEVFSLEVRETNTAAIKLYEGLGFKRVGRRPDFYEKPREDALLYELGTGVIPC